ncbi:MAG: hypothetical protein JNL60_09895 [Bacteroidia bacterium]|nr:hypothetical protein [Bacteroidia bacterium]
MKKQYKLIDGTFEPNEAKNILFALFNSKINFHAMESFGITIRTSGDTSAHDLRIKQLSKASSEIMALMRKAEKKNQILKIDGIVTINILSKKNAG